MTIYAVDPGPNDSQFLVLHNGAVIESSHLPNADLRGHLQSSVPGSDVVLAVEAIESYGMPVGRETFDTCIEIGRLVQIWEGHACRVLRVPRQSVKLYLCRSAKAKDSNVRQALIDRLGAPGKKSAPGPTFGVSGHGWQALGVAVTAAAKLRGEPDLEAVTWQ